MPGVRDFVLKWDADQGGASWATVAAPDAAFDFLATIGAVQQSGGSYQFKFTAGSLQAHAGIAVAKTYYVDKSTGNNANTGLSWAQALADLKTAFGKADVDRVYIRNSWLNYAEIIPLPSRNIEVIATDNNVVLSPDLNNYAGAFSAVDGHYEATFGGSSYVTSVYDLADTSSGYWWGTPLAVKASAAEVDATPGSFYYVYGSPNSTMYIHTFDGRAPDTSLRHRGSTALTVSVDNWKAYFYGLKLQVSIFRNATAAGGLKVYLENCTFAPVGATIAGVDEIVLLNCTGNGSGDTVNVDARNGIVTKQVEINCDLQNRSTSTSSQASTGHNGCFIVRLNGVYHDVSGQCCAEAQAASRTWMLGSELHTSRASDVGYFTDGVAWLDGCYIHNVTTDLDGAGTVNKRNLRSGGVYNPGLTVQDY